MQLRRNVPKHHWKEMEFKLTENRLTWVNVPTEQSAETDRTIGLFALENALEGKNEFEKEEAEKRLRELKKPVTSKQELQFRLKEIEFNERRLEALRNEGEKLNYSDLNIWMEQDVGHFFDVSAQKKMQDAESQRGKEGFLERIRGKVKRVGKELYPKEVSRVDVEIEKPDELSAVIEEFLLSK